MVQGKGLQCQEGEERMGGDSEKASPMDFKFSGCWLPQGTLFYLCLKLVTDDGRKAVSVTGEVVASQVLAVVT